MNTRKLFLALFFTVVMALVALPNSALAAKPSCGDGSCNGNETPTSCPTDCTGGGGGDSYRVALTSGPFTFGPTEVSLNNKGSLVGAVDLVIQAPLAGTLERTAWDAVMGTCGGPLSPVPGQIIVDADDWSVYKNSPTNISINLETIYLPNSGPIKKEIQIILRDYDPGPDFLPPSPGSTDFPLFEYVIWGKPKGGPHSGWDTCYHSDSDEVPTLPGLDPGNEISTLLISSP